MTYATTTFLQQRAISPVSPIMTSNSGGAADLAREFANDAEELVELILPSCQDQPYLHNLIASMIQSLYKEADALAGRKVPQVSFVMFMPSTELDEEDAWQERLRDAQRLDYMILGKFRSLRQTNKAKLAALQRRLHQEVAQLKKHLVEETRRRQVELKRTLTLIRSLMKECVADHVHVYNLFAVEMQRFQADYDRLKFVEQDELYQDVAEAPVGLDGLWHRVKRGLSPPASPQTGRVHKRLPEEHAATAEDRWMDVVWLDDALDRMEDELSIRRMLLRFKNQCHSEAKMLQKREALQMMPSPTHVPDLTVGF